MNETELGVISDSPLHQPVDFSQAIAGLRLAGAAQFDPVRLHYIEVLLHRVNGQRDSVQRVLKGKLTQSLTELRERLEHSQCEAKDTLDQVAPNHPHAAANLQRLFAAGDFSALKRRIASLKSGSPVASLGDLARHIAQHSQENGASRLDDHIGAHTELKSIRYFRNTWSKLSADRTVIQALDQAPKNAGPINSHMLVLRSIALMRDIAPDYLTRFMSYADTLLCLDQCGKEKQAVSKLAADGASNKKTKHRRVRSG